MEPKVLNVIKICLALLLIACVLDWPYGYFMFVRLAATVGFGVLAHSEWKRERIPSLILLVGLAILFQPFAKIPLGRELWNVVDVVVGIGLIAWAVLGKNPKD